MRDAILEDDQADGFDRRQIQVGSTATQEGIAAALRRAFVSIQNPPESDEFDRLLAQIH